jgi:two-component system sensor histidine kinase RstB
MKKSLISLFFIIIFSLASIQLLIIPYFESNVRHPTEKWALEFLTSGSTNLLTKQLRNLPKHQRNAHLRSVKTNFGFDLVLQKWNKSDFSNEQNQWLARNEIWGDPLADLAYLRVDDEQLLVIVKPNSVPKYLINEAQRWTMGSFYQLNNKLINQPENMWSSIIELASHDFKYAVSLQSLNELDYMEEDMTSLRQGNIVTISSDDSNFIGYPADIAIQRIGNSDKVIVLGPFSSELKDKVVYMLTILYLIFGVFLLVPIILWLSPAWRSMTSLNKVALLLGQGKFDVRANIVRFSHLNHLSKTFNTMAEKIQRLISSHKHLVNAVSHELRTPIARIEFNIELLRNSTENNYQLGQLDRIEFSLNELNALVTEMLTHARFDRETPELTFESVELNEWIRQELKLWQETNPALEIALVEYITCDAMIDRFYMSRALGNLIRNAIAYGRGQIHVSYKKTSTGWLIQVDDNGDGIPSSSIDKIFEPFYRIDKSRNLQTGGTGLGLAIVQQILDWHGGSANVDSSLLGGACFILSWPVKLHNLDNA